MLPSASARARVSTKSTSTRHSAASRRTTGARINAGKARRLSPKKPQRDAVGTVRILGDGEFAWLTDERKSQRWGAFFLESPDRKRSPYDADAIRALVGLRVRLTAEIVALRPPPQHEVPFDCIDTKIGDRIELGVGTLRLETVDRQLKLPLNRVLVLQTGDRPTYWMNSLTFWFLREHRVFLRAEVTGEACRPSLESVLNGPDRVSILRRYRQITRTAFPSLAQMRRIVARHPNRRP